LSTDIFYIFIVNVEKANFIIFNFHRKDLPRGSLDLIINDITDVILVIYYFQVESFKFLGIYIDQNMSWKVHINKITAKIATNRNRNRKLDISTAPTKAR